ncbi:MAG: dihydrofolate reductase [Candidatus Moranbacteria bacterium]|nr:dihydrofolate reductase [Candidatus Moranbacteria bacterium]
MNNPKVSIVAAIGKNRELGKDNSLLWQIPEDLKRFKRLTSGHVIVMGEKTFHSIGRPLPHRTNVVLSRDENFSPDGVVVARSIDDALLIARKHEREEIFVIGGAQIYEQFLLCADRLYLTLVEGDFEADTFFPEYENIFSQVVSLENFFDGGYECRFVVLDQL